MRRLKIDSLLINPKCIKHWRQPVVMLGGLLAGTAVAIGHHVFYKSLDDQYIGNKISQQWNLAIGTGLAFSVRVLLSISVGTAIVQCFWHSLFESAGRRRRLPVTLENVDRLFSITTNLVGFVHPGVWAFNPLMALSAALFWCLPLTVIFAPATLSIGPLVIVERVDPAFKAPLIDFTNGAMLKCSESSADTLVYGSAGDKLSQLAGIVASLGTIYYSSATPQFPNSAYRLSFEAPTLSCHPFPTSGAPNFRDSASYYVSAPIKPPPWTILDQIKALNTIDSNTSDMDTYSLFDWTGAGGMRLFIVRQGSFHGDWDGYGGDWESAWRTGRGISECVLFNSILTADFHVTDGSREIRIVNEENLNPVAAVREIALPVGDSANSKSERSYNGTRDFGYMAIMETVGSLIGGWLSLEEYSPVEGPSQVLSTALVLSEEFDLYRLKVSLMNTHSNGWTSSVGLNGFGERGNRTFAFGVESLFRNITLSLFSQGAFLDRHPPKVNITIRSPQNVYTYSARNMFVSYGLGIVLTSLSCLYGLYCVFRGQGNIAASTSDLDNKNVRLYSSNFSTILRVSRNNTELDALVEPEDTSGADPLPKYLARTGLLMGTFGGNNEAEGGRMIGASSSQEASKADDESQSHDRPELRYGLLVYPNDHGQSGQ